jgi:hypothetical protein
MTPSRFTQPAGTPSTSPIWIPRACRFPRCSSAGDGLASDLHTLPCIPGVPFVRRHSGRVSPWTTLPGRALIRNIARPGSPSRSAFDEEKPGLPRQGSNLTCFALGGLSSPCHGRHENEHGCTFLGSPEPLSLSRGGSWMALRRVTRIYRSF